MPGRVKISATEALRRKAVTPAQLREMEAEAKEVYFSEPLSLCSACFIATTYARIAAHLEQVMQWPSKARASSGDRFPSR